MSRHQTSPRCPVVLHELGWRRFGRMVPSTRPNRDVLISCNVRWVADPYESLEGKAPCLEILREVLQKGGSSEMDA